MGDQYKDWRDRLADANDPAFWPIEAIDALIAQGQAQFWATDKAALVTRVVTYPGGAVALEAMAASGEKAELVETIAPAVEEQAREAGLTHMKVPGRPGWGRALKQHDFRLHQEILIKELADGQ